MEEKRYTHDKWELADMDSEYYPDIQKNITANVFINLLLTVTAPPPPKHKYCLPIVN